jgi:crotonobetaine/carnitine-CoA ligase
LAVPQTPLHHTLEGLLAQRVWATPDKVCYYLDDTPVTFAQLHNDANAAANSLLKLGVLAGDSVALFADSCAQWLAVWLALPRIGALSVPVNTMFKGDFLAHQLRDAAATVALVSARLLDRVLELVDELPELHTVVVLGEYPDASVPVTSRLRVLSAEVLSGGDEHDVAGGAGPLGWNEPASLMYTSGTTGPSKGVMVSQHYLISGAQVVVDAGGWSGHDVLYGAVPLFHGSGLLGLVLPPLVTGCTSVIDTQFSVSGCWDRVRKYGATGMMAVGPMIVMLWSLAESENDSRLPLEVVLAAPIPAELHHAIEKRYGVRLTTIYGLTEAQPITVMPVSGPAVPGSAGKASPNFEVRVVDDNDEEVATGEIGEIVCRPRRPHVMFEGYRGRDADTLRQTRNLWFHTGDFGRLDAEGYLFFVDRKKDAIRRRGENISSVELERSVAAHPGVLECAALPVPNELGEDDVKVAVILADANLTHKELMDHCVAEIPYFALPRYIEFVDQLPRNATGRVQKFLLREQAITPATWDREAAGYVIAR